MSYNKIFTSPRDPRAEEKPHPSVSVIKLELPSTGLPLLTTQAQLLQLLLINLKLLQLQSFCLSMAKFFLYIPLHNQFPQRSHQQLQQ